MARRGRSLAFQPCPEVFPMFSESCVEKVVWKGTQRQIGTAELLESVR